MSIITDDLANVILTTMSDALVVTDRDGIIRFWNPGAPASLALRPRTPSATRSILLFQSGCRRDIGQVTSVS